MGVARDPLEEYKEAGSNLRHFSSMRFGQLTLFTAITAGLFVAGFQADPPLEDRVSLAVKLLGVVVTAVFWLMEERSTMYFKHFRRRSRTLEQNLGFDLWTNRPSASGGLNSTNAVRVLYAALGLAWIAAVVDQL